MCSNVLPSAPHDESSLYPQLSPHDFRMQKANEVAAALNAKVAHYRGVAKKYKRAKKIVNWSASGSGLLSAGFSTAGLGTALGLWVFQPQFHSAALEGHSLLLLQG